MREIELCPSCYSLTVKQPFNWFCIPCVSILHHNKLYYIILHHNTSYYIILHQLHFLIIYMYYITLESTSSCCTC